jgi:predicted HTH domain antitoxin
MSLKITLPDDKEQFENTSREAIEIKAVEGYCAGALSDADVARMLNLSISETDDFLKKRGLFDFENAGELKLDALIQ